MHYIAIVEKDEEGKVQGGMNFWWEPGAHIYLSQPWEYSCAGNDYGVVSPDPVYVDLLTTVKETWIPGSNMVLDKFDDDYH